MPSTCATHAREGETIKVSDFTTVAGLSYLKSNFVRKHSATAGRMDDAATIWAHLVLNIREDEVDALELAQVPDELRSLGAKQ